MKTNKVTKDFDCVEFKRGTQAEIYEEIKDLAPEDEIDYFREKAESGPMGEWWKVLKHRSASERAVVRRK